MSFEYNISEEFRPFAKRVLKSAYPNNEIVPLGLLDKDYESDVISMNQSGFLILPMGQTIDDYSEMHGYLDDGDLCLTGNTRDTQEHYMRRILLLSFNCENYLVTMQRKTGIYISDISLKDLQTITWNDLINTNALASTETSMCRELKPKTYTDFIGIFACAHDTYADFEDSIYDNSWERFQLRKQPEFIEFPCYTREDFYDSAISQGLDNEVAFEFSELVRKGKVNRTPELLDDFNLPDSLKKTAESCLYLFPRAHCATCILTYATLAYYMKQDSRAFSRLIYKKK